MPYTDACIHEVQRFADIIPMGVFHAAGSDIEFEGYTIPEVNLYYSIFKFLVIKNNDNNKILKGTMVVGYVGNCHRDTKYWAKPNEFYPQHFLDMNGQLKKNVEGFIPFSTGIHKIIARIKCF